MARIPRPLLVPLALACALAAPRTAPAACSAGNANQFCIAQGDINPTAEGPELDDHFGETLAWGDFDADGRDDLVIGTPDEDFVGLNAGQVDVYSSLGLHFFHIQRTFRQNGTIGADEGSENDDRMGGTLAVGDYDGDGYDDLAIAAPSEDTVAPFGTGICGHLGLCDDIGLVQIIWGRDGGLFENQATTLDFFQAQFDTHEPLTLPMNMGACLAAGDYDQDGIDDLAIGAPGSDFGENADGALSLMHGETDRNFVHDGYVTRASSSSFDRLGSACAIGRFATPSDINYFKRVVVAGCPGCDPASSGEAGLLLEDQGNTLDEIPQTDFGTAGNGANDGFGSHFAVGDFDDDGFEDLAIGVPNKNDGGVTDSGRVYVAFGASAGLPLGGFRILGLDSFPGVALEEDAHFGAALAAGDLDGDGVDDLAIGAPNLGNDDRGFVFVAFGKRNTSLLDIRAAFVISAPSVGGSAQGSAHFGAALAIGDMGASSAAELAISAPDENAGATDSGRVYVTRIFDPHWVFGDGFESEGLAVWSGHTP